MQRSFEGGAQSGAALKRVNTVITERPIVEKIWDALHKNGYVIDFQDFLGSYVGTIILK